MFADVFTGQDVLVTGHTGFKGSWLALWLEKLGARVHGLALSPEPWQTLFEQLGIPDTLITDSREDIRDLQAVCNCLQRAKPRFVFHMAAQPLVRLSYDIPVETFSSNVMGTCHVLEAVRRYDADCIVVVVTSDKCYENKEWPYAYRECDAVGGHDPYSASKGAAEIITSSYHRSYFSAAKQVYMASARAGNVIGGGDWSKDRIVPDVMRSLFKGQEIPVRNPNAVRPWQHVFEPLFGYLSLAAKLFSDQKSGSPNRGESFNFGPNGDACQNVASLVHEVLKLCPGRMVDASGGMAAHEANMLMLANDKARLQLGWHPTWTFETAVAETVQWYLAAREEPKAIREFSLSQLTRFCRHAAENGNRWALN